MPELWGAAEQVQSRLNVFGVREEERHNAERPIMALGLGAASMRTGKSRPWRRIGHYPVSDGLEPA